MDFFPDEEIQINPQKKHFFCVDLIPEIDIVGFFLGVNEWDKVHGVESVIFEGEEQSIYRNFFCYYADEEDKKLTGSITFSDTTNIEGHWEAINVVYASDKYKLSIWFKTYSDYIIDYNDPNKKESNYDTVLHSFTFIDKDNDDKQLIELENLTLFTMNKKPLFSKGKGQNNCVFCVRKKDHSFIEILLFNLIPDINPDLKIDPTTRNLIQNLLEEIYAILHPSIDDIILI